MSLCWLCPGQGSQTASMFRRLVLEPSAAEILADLFVQVEPQVRLSAHDDTCFLNRNAQPLIVLYGASVAATLAKHGLAPAIVCGYSVGELTAHVVAGALSASSGLHLASVRAAAMDAVAPPNYGMLAVRGPTLDVIESCANKFGAEIAIHNGPTHAVLAGSDRSLEDLARLLGAEFGAHVVRLPIQVPAHSHWLAGAVGSFRRELEATQWTVPSGLVLSALGGQPMHGGQQAIEALSRQLAAPLDWARTLDLAVEMGARVFFELGPGNGLTRMLRERYPSFSARALDEFATLEGAALWLRRQGDAY